MDRSDGSRNRKIIKNEAIEWLKANEYMIGTNQREILARLSALLPNWTTEWRSAGYDEVLQILKWDAVMFWLDEDLDFNSSSGVINGISCARRLADLESKVRQSGASFIS